MNAAMPPLLPLIPTKLAIPMLPPGLLERPRLDEWQLRLPQVRLAVLHAASGFGKTTLAAQGRGPSMAASPGCSCMPATTWGCSSAAT